MRSAQRTLLIAALLASGSGVSLAHAAGTWTKAEARSIAAAAAPAPWAADVSAASGYVARGIRRKGGRPALQARVDYARRDGWFAGARVSGIDGRVVEHGWLEMDLHGGYKGSAGPLGYKTSASYYRYPGVRGGANTGPDYGELAACLNWKTLYARYNMAFTPNFVGIPDARGSGYLDVGARQELFRAVMLDLHAGDGRVAGASRGAFNWQDMSAGLSRRLEDGWVVAANYSRALGATGVFDRYTSGNARLEARPLASGRRALVLSLSRKF